MAVIESKYEAIKLSITDLKRSMNKEDLTVEYRAEVEEQISWLEFIRDELRDYDALKTMIRKIAA